MARTSENFLRARRAMSRISTEVPDSFTDVLSRHLNVLADNFKAVTDKLDLAPSQIRALSEELSQLMLRREITEQWDDDRGLMFVVGDGGWTTYTPNGAYRGEYGIDEVPKEWRRQLGMLKLQEEDSVLVRNAGVKIDSGHFYLLEDKQYAVG